MDEDQFIDETHAFMTLNEDEAVQLAKKYNRIGVNGHTIVPAKWGEYWCVMLDTAYQCAKDLGI